MASLYQRKEKGKKAASPFWWIKFRDPDTGEIRRESTGFRVGNGPDRRRAEELRAEYTLREARTVAVSASEKWDAWVDDYFALRYAASDQSLTRARSAWRTMGMFLREHDIEMPRQLKREHCVAYMKWRKKPDKKNGKYQAGHNTAQIEIKFLTIIMSEAVNRHYAPYNPCRDLRIKRLPPKRLKPEFTPQAVALILAAIPREPEPKRTFFDRSFRMGMLHGVRISETYFNPLDRITTAIEFDQEGKPVTFKQVTFRTKGGKEHTVKIHDELLPLFEKLIAEGKTETYPRPKSPSKEWFNFLKRAGVKDLLPGACFHSGRVTVCSELSRNPNVKEKDAMSYVGHASTTINRAYVRHRSDDLAKCSQTLSLPQPADTNPPP